MNQFFWCADSPYCRLVKAVLIAKQFPHDDILLSWEDLSALPGILKVESGFERVPTLKRDDHLVSDSGWIINDFQIFTGDSQSGEAFMLYRIADSDLGRVLQTFYHAKKLERKFGRGTETEWLSEQAQKELSLSLRSVLAVLRSSSFQTQTLASLIALMGVQIFLTFIQSVAGMLEMREFCAVKTYLIDFEGEDFFKRYQTAFEPHSYKIPLRL